MKLGQKLKKEIEELIKQLKSDLGIIPYSDINDPGKFAGMSMSMVEENIDDFQEVLLSKLQDTPKSKEDKK